MKTDILYFDIGNTNIKLGVCSGPLQNEAAAIRAYSFPTNDGQTADQFGLTLLSALSHAQSSPDKIKACVGASVVPGVTQLVDKACRRFLDTGLTLAPEDLPIPLENRYARPHEVGADRLVGAYAARRLFPEAASIISVDFGTATTIDCVEGNAYLGGLICPGVLSSASALSSRTAKLPQMNLVVEDREPAPGRSTFTSLNHGFVFGFAAMTEGLCARLAKGLKPPVLVIGTGGFASPLSKVTDCFDHVMPDLLLRGLAMLYEEHGNKR